MGNELLTGFLAGQSDNNNSGNNGSGFFGNEGLWAVIILAIIFGWGNNGNGFGSRNGGGNGGDNVTVVPYPAPSCYGGFGGGYPTEAVLQRALDIPRRSSASWTATPRACATASTPRATPSTAWGLPSCRPLLRRSWLAASSRPR